MVLHRPVELARSLSPTLIPRRRGCGFVGRALCARSKLEERQIHSLSQGCLLCERYAALKMLTVTP